MFNSKKCFLGNQPIYGLLACLCILSWDMRKYFNRLHTSALKVFTAELFSIYPLGVPDFIGID